LPLDDDRDGVGVSLVVGLTLTGTGEFEVAPVGDAMTGGESGDGLAAVGGGAGEGDEAFRTIRGLVAGAGAGAGARLLAAEQAIQDSHTESVAGRDTSTRREDNGKPTMWVDVRLVLAR